ncbi:M56 family metallopeptidase [Jatrophihabitans sp. DSM 45814]
MTVGAALLGYALILGVLGPMAARHEAWLARAPRLGAMLLLAAAWSVLTALFLAGLTVALPGTALSSGLSELLGACILRLRAAYVTPGGAAVAGAGLTLSTAIAVRVCLASLQVVRVRRAERRRQRTLVRLCGREAAELGAVILDQAQPAAYCLAGRSSTVVLTSGAVELLTGPQLAAVLAHERAHLGARHHRLLASAALAARTLPELPLMRGLPAQVRGLLEMHADELAAGAHDPETLATALVAVATAQSASGAARPPAMVSSATLAAADGDTLNRIRRLLLPPDALSPRRRRAARAAVLAFGLLPLLLALTPAAVAANQPPVRQVQTVRTTYTSQNAQLGHGGQVRQTARDVVSSSGLSGVKVHPSPSR